MARAVVSAEDVSAYVSGVALFEGVSFEVGLGERVALVGPNGCGKSTLLKMIGGRAPVQDGTVWRAPRLPLAWYDQHPPYGKDDTARDVLAAAARLPEALAEELAALEARLADPALYESGEADAVVARYGELQRDAARARASAGAEESPLVEELGFAPDDLGRKVATLSGGERTRLFLARTLSEADPQGLLVLDEPTNHLDVETIEWLEEWLQGYGGAVLLVAHDRAFLDNVATRTLAFHDGRVEAFDGGYSDYERQREEDQHRLALRREREEKELQRQKAVIEQFRHQKRFNGQMASRLTSLTKYRATIDKTPDPLVQKVQMHLAVQAMHKSSQDVLRIRGLGKKWGDRLLFYDLDLDVKKGDRIALIGANGAGKTTLLRVITGKETKDVGAVEVAPGVKGAYYAQGNEQLDVANTLAKEIQLVRPHIEFDDVRALLGRFGFRRPGDPERKVATLSGGERARLALLKTILSPCNLLILDEPTNHLDIESRGALVRALNAYDGSLLVVSHDRWFLDSVVNKVALLARKKIKTFVGDLTEARTSVAMEEFSVEKPVKYLVRKGFKDFETGVKHTVGSTVALTPAEMSAKRLYRTALSMGWMTEE